MTLRIIKHILIFNNYLYSKVILLKKTTSIKVTIIIKLYLEIANSPSIERLFSYVNTTFGTPKLSPEP